MIVEFAGLDFKTARALLLTSKSLSQWAIPFLYATVHLRKKNSAAKFLAALDASLDSLLSSKGQYVEELNVYAYEDPKTGRDLLPDILVHTTALTSFTWKCKTETPLPAAFPMTLKTLNIHFLNFDSTNWPAEEFMLNTAYWNIEELQVATKHERDPHFYLIRTFSFMQFSSLKYISLRSYIRFRTSAAFVTHIRNVIIPQFPSTLKVCVLYDVVSSNELKELIMGYVDDRIILSVDDELELSPGAPYSDFLIRKPRRKPFITSSSWEEIVKLMQRRKHLRVLWMGQFPRSETKVMITDYWGYIPPWALPIGFVIFFPAIVYWTGERVWRRIRR
ncbi:hypothetical protein DL96DRAFT_1607768 [Flagelloscypha sp. PMI_526]|nr:hypothetical protein DL96DRAFT_1607768 [Flagelloscypha sp. PMI_526]